MRTKYAARQPVLKAGSVCKNQITAPLKRPRRSIAAFTLAEIVVCIAIVAMLFGGIITTYMQGAYRAEWAGYNLAAQALAMQQIEQAKSAVWDSDHNEFTNLVRQSAAILDLPINGTNRIYATNYVTVTTNQISSGPDLFVQMVKVDTVWPYVRKDRILYFTNTVADYYAPDK
jgi:type II secretory pathway pseudopilin PulG